MEDKILEYRKKIVEIMEEYKERLQKEIEHKMDKVVYLNKTINEIREELKKNGANTVS